MSSHKELLEAEEAWSAFNTYLKAKERILHKNPCEYERALLKRCKKGLAKDRLELDVQWAKLDNTLHEELTSK